MVDVENRIKARVKDILHSHTHLTAKRIIKPLFWMIEWKVRVLFKFWFSTSFAVIATFKDVPSIIVHYFQL